jgi:hypothetical protein
MGRAAKTALAMRAPKAARGSQRVHSFTRFTTPFVLPKASADQGFAYSVALADVVSSAEFTALFDEYKVVGVEATFIVTGVSIPGGTYPVVYYYPDYDDATAPSAQSVALQVEGMKIWATSAVLPIKRWRIKPRAALTVGGPGAASEAGLWLDVAYPAVPNYGFKGWISNYNSSTYAGTFIQVVFKVELQFRSVR